MLNLTTTCSAVIQKSLPEEMQDPGSFIIPYTIGIFEFKKALCDSGASINFMPLLVIKKLCLGELTVIVVTFQMENKTMTQPEGAVEYVLINVGNSFSLWTL